MVIKLLFQYSLRPKSSNGCQTLKRCIEMLEHRTSGCNTAQHSHESVACLDMNHQGKIIHEPILPYTMPEQQLDWCSITQMALTLHDKTKSGMTLHHITQRDITSHYITLHGTRSHYKIWHHMIFHCMMWYCKRESCKHLFKRLKILTLPSQYIFSVLVFIAENRDLFMFNRDIHSFNTRKTTLIYTCHLLI